ncbi:MAG: GNAT family N-acetyltransferase [Chloroflexi bacterium]|nr:GNAT family N-acetyltransferase [Chloroflexota bacterium]
MPESVDSTRIRVAVDSDLDLLSKSLSAELPRAQIVNRFSEQRAGLRILLVLELGAELAGTVSYDPRPDEDGLTRRLFALDVGAAFRRRGFATRLIQEVERLMVRDGQSVVRLDVAVDNTGAIALYERLGYERVGEPWKLQWSQQVDGHPTELVVELSHRMEKRLNQ